MRIKEQEKRLTLQEHDDDDHTTLNTVVINSAYHKAEVYLTEIFLKKRGHFIVKTRRLRQTSVRYEITFVRTV